MELIFATKNRGKLKEIIQIMEDSPFQILSMEEAGIDVDVEEDGDTFAQNAMKKALEIMRLSGKAVFADDSGLEIDALDKKPGVYSARFLGKDTPYSEKNAKILAMLGDVPREGRTARFKSVIAAAFPDGRTFTAEGEMEGIIAYDIKGENGFGYDPIFFVPEYGMTAAEMSGEQKNAISHRGKALRNMKTLLEEAFSEQCYQRVVPEAPPDRT